MFVVNEADAAEFDCVDCGLHVISVAPPHNPDGRCAGCAWLHTLPEDEHVELRAVLRARKIIGPEW